MEDSHDNKCNEKDKIAKKKGGRPSKSAKKKKAGDHEKPSKEEMGEKDSIKEAEREEGMVIDPNPPQFNENLSPKGIVSAHVDHESNSPSLGVSSEEVGVVSPCISSSSGEKESQPIALNEDGGRSGKDGGEAEFSLYEVEKLVDWDLEEMALRLWEGEGVGESWPWVWGEETCGEFGGGIFDNVDFGAFKDDYLDGWLVSDVL